MGVFNQKMDLFLGGVKFLKCQAEAIWLILAHKVMIIILGDYA